MFLFVNRALSFKGVRILRKSDKDHSEAYEDGLPK